MTHLFRKVLASTAVAAAATTGLAGSASAATGKTLADVQQLAAAAIIARLTALGAASGAVGANKWMTTADKSSATGIINSDTAGLTALGAKIQSDTTVAQATADYRTVFTGYRVYLLALPQIRLAAANDDLTLGAIPRLSDAQTRLEKLLSGPDESKDTAQVQAAMADLAKQIAGAQAALSGVSSQTLLSYTPAQFNADTSILASARAALGTARGDLKAARADVTTVLEAIK